MIGADARPAWHWPFLAGVVVLAVALRLQEDLLFHTVAETLCIVLAAAAFRAAWRAPFGRNDFLIFVAIVLFWSGVLDFVHMLLYKGITRLDIGDADPATQIWIGTRYLQAAGFLAAPCFLVRPLNRLNAFAVFGGAAVGLLAAVLAGAFPLAHIVGPGPRGAFKLASQLVVTAILVAALAFLWLRRARLDRATLQLVGAGIAVLLGTELAFTLYIDMERVSNAAGHLLKVAGYWLLYQAMLRPASRPAPAVPPR